MFGIGENMLTDKEILALQRVLVADNESITHIRRGRGTYGAGNTNTSGYSGGSADRALDEYENKPLYGRSTSSGVDIAAIVEDVLYLVEYSYGDCKVIRLRPFETYSTERGVAYDTYEVHTITPVSNIVHTITTEIGTYTGTAIKGVPEGRGVYIYNENDPWGRVRCEGYFVSGVPQRRCKVSFRDGSWYEGWMKDGLFEDDGEYHYPNGEYYHGYFQKGKMHGSGMLYTADGKVKHNGWWKDGNISK